MVKVTPLNPTHIGFQAEKQKQKNPYKKLTGAILPSSYRESSLSGHTAQALPSQESSALGRLFRPLKTFIQKSLNLPLSQKELAKKVEEFALSPACKALGGPSLNTQQVYALALEILKRESEGAPSLKNRAEIGGKSLELF
jgi:hypothetical protein